MSRWFLLYLLLLAPGCTSEPVSNPGVVRDDDARSQYGPRPIERAPLPRDPYAGLLGSQAELPPQPDPSEELNALEEMALRGLPTLEAVTIEPDGGPGRRVRPGPGAAEEQPAARGPEGPGRPNARRQGAPRGARVDGVGQPPVDGLAGTPAASASAAETNAIGPESADLQGTWSAWCEPAAAQREDVTYAPRIEEQALLIGVEREGLSFDWRVHSGREPGLGAIGIQEPGQSLLPFDSWVLEPAEVSSGVVQHTPSGASMTLVHEGGLVLMVEPVGGSLRIDLEAPAGAPYLLDHGVLRALSGVEWLTALQLPYLDHAAVGVLTREDGSLRYVSVWQDLMVSGATRVETLPPSESEDSATIGQRVQYLADSAGEFSPLRERLWLSYSDELFDVLPAMQRAPASGRVQSESLWYVELARSGFAESASGLRALSALGVRDLQLWLMQWSGAHFVRARVAPEDQPDALVAAGAQCNLPYDGWGGQDGMLALRSAAEEFGYGFSLASDWSLASPPGPRNLISGSEALQLLKPNVALRQVGAVEGRLHEGLRTQGSFVGSMSSGVPPVERDVADPLHASLALSIDARRQLFESLREVHGAPLAGLGSDSLGNLLWTGHLDVTTGGSGQQSPEASSRVSGAALPLIADYSLQRLNPVALRAGLGSPAEWAQPALAEGIQLEPREALDAYESANWLFGNAGWSRWDEGTDVSEVARDWWANGPARRRLSSVEDPVREVLYANAMGELVDLGSLLALRQVPRLGSTRVRVQRQSGSLLWVNMTPHSWALPEGGAAVGMTLAPWGRLLIGGDIRAGLLENKDGEVFAFSQSGPLTHLDGRGSPVGLAGMRTDGAVGIELVSREVLRLTPLGLPGASASEPRLVPELLSLPCAQIGVAPGGEVAARWLGLDARVLSEEQLSVGEGGVELPWSSFQERGALAVELVDLDASGDLPAIRNEASGGLASSSGPEREQSPIAVAPLAEAPAAADEPVTPAGELEQGPAGDAPAQAAARDAMEPSLAPTPEVGGAPGPGVDAPASEPGDDAAGRGLQPGADGVRGGADVVAPTGHPVPSELPGEGPLAAWDGWFEPAAAQLQTARFTPRQEDGAFVIEVLDAELSFEWRIQVEGDGGLDAISIREPGLRVAPFSDWFMRPEEALVGPIQASRRGRGLHLGHEGGFQLAVEPSGRALRIEMAAPAGRVTELRTGILRALEESGCSVQALQLPYLDQAAIGVVRRADGSVRYLGLWFDLLASAATEVQPLPVTNQVGPGGGASIAQRVSYGADSAGALQPMREQLWLSWSDRLLDVLPAMRREPSAGRDEAGDLWYVELERSSLSETAEELRRLHTLGARDLQLWATRWSGAHAAQRSSAPGELAQGLSAVGERCLQPSEVWGGEDELQLLRATAEQLGQGLALALDWSLAAPPAPGALVLGSDGAPRSELALKPRLALEELELVEGGLHESFATVGSQVGDVTAGAPLVDLDADEPGHASMASALELRRRLLQGVRSVHGAPLAGGGSQGFGQLLWSGHVDVARGDNGMRVHSADSRDGGPMLAGAGLPLVPHFALERLLPLGLRAGLGERSSFFDPAGKRDPRVELAHEREIYVSQSWMYASAGWSRLGDERPASDLARDWWANASAQRRLARADDRVLDVRYDDGQGQLYTLDELLRADQVPTLGEVRMRVMRESGTLLWINLTPEPWPLAEGGAADGAELAPWGRLLIGPDVRAGLVLEQGRRMSFVSADERSFLDGHGEPVRRAGVLTDGAVGLSSAAGVLRVTPLAYVSSRNADGEARVQRTEILRLAPAILGAKPMQEVRVRWLGLDGENLGEEWRLVTRTGLDLPWTLFEQLGALVAEVHSGGRTRSREQFAPELGGQAGAGGGGGRE